MLVSKYQKGVAPIAIILAVVAIIASTMFGIAMISAAVNIAKSGPCGAWGEVLGKTGPVGEAAAKSMEALCNLIGAGEENEEASSSGSSLNASYPIGDHILSGRFVSLNSLGIKNGPYKNDKGEVDEYCAAATREVMLLIKESLQDQEVSDDVKITGAHGMHSENGGHREGAAIDVSGGGLSNKTAPVVQMAIQNSPWQHKSISVRKECSANGEPKTGVLDEYNCPSPNSTGKHMHIKLYCSPTVAIKKTSCSSFDYPKTTIAKAGSKQNLDRWVGEAAIAYFGGDEAALSALIKIESGWLSDATPKKDKNGKQPSALGLGQFQPRTASIMKAFIGGKDRKADITWEKGGAIDRSANDPRRDPRRSIFAAADYFTNSLENDKNTEKYGKCSEKQTMAEKLRCGYIYGYHRGCNPGDNTGPNEKSCIEAKKGGERLVKTYQLLLKKQVCSVTGEGADSAIKTGERLKPSNTVKKYSPSDLPISPGRKVNLSLNTTLGDALVAAVREARSKGITIHIYSANDGGHSKNSRHYKGLAVDIAAYRNNKNICMQKSFINGRNLCDSELQEIMADHGLANLCYAFSGYRRGDCNHFQLSNKPTAKKILPVVLATPNTTISISIPTPPTTSITYTSESRGPFTVSVADIRKFDLRTAPSEMIDAKQPNKLQPKNLLLSSTAYARLYAAWSDPVCGKKCFKIHEAFRSKSHQEEAWIKNRCTNPSAPATTAGQPIPKDPSTQCKGGDTVAVPGYSNHEGGNAVDIRGFGTGFSCTGSCDKKMVDLMKKYKMNIYKGCSTIKDNMYTGKDCWHFSTTGD